MARHKEEHHVIPISLMGPNWKENCIILTDSEHKHVHEVLDIPHGLLRRFRKRTNHLVYWDTYYVEQLEVLHKLYFARIDFLEDPILTKHYDALCATINRTNVSYKIGFVDPHVRGNTAGKFRGYLNYYHSILYEVAKRNEERLFEQHHPTI